MAEINGIRVTVFRKETDGSFKNCGYETTGDDDQADGAYIVRGLESGTYTLKFEDTGDGVTGRPAKFYRTVYLGNVNTIDLASTFTLAASETDHDFTPVAGLAISGVASVA